jgi:AraC-like DNA-binding protein
MLFSGLNGDPILLFAWNGADTLDPERLAELLDECVHNVKTYLKLDIFISLGSIVGDFRSVHLSYSEACHLKDRGLPPSDAGPDAHPAIVKVINYIDRYYAEEMSLKTLSQHFNFNAAYLGQLFKKATGEMFSVYLNTVRIEKSKQLLVETHMKTGEIAAAVGFSNVQYFSNVFHKLTGVYPTDYKRGTGGTDPVGGAGGIRATRPRSFRLG